MADGDDADGAALAGAEFTIQPRGDGLGAVNASEQAAAAVLRVQTTVAAQGERLRGIAVTWSPDATAEAALLLESLTEAGFDNVVPVEGVTEAEAQLALAHGAALALGPNRELSDAFNGVSTDAPPDDHSAPQHATGQVRSRTLSYTGALAMLVAGAVSFVVSTSIALSLHLGPAKEVRPAHQVAEAPATPPIAKPVAPAAAETAPPPAAAGDTPPEAPAASDPPSGEAPVNQATVDGGVAAPPEDGAVAGLPPEPGPGHPLLNRVRNYLRGAGGR
ncbi:MAG TPA: hypothetical protein VFR27_15810 [Mycobacterium sp.]|nr:hypothetical protein [Mycobacterium sp.]